MAPAEHKVDSGRVLFDGAGLEKALVQGSFDRPATHLIGMVRASESTGHVGFAPSGCGSWVDIPSAMIRDAQHLGQQPCGDHSHALFRLTLHEPTDPQAKVLLQLMAARASGPDPGGIAAHMSPGLACLRLEGLPFAPSTGGSRQPQCSSWCVGSTLMCGCPVRVPGFGTGYVVYPCGTCINDPVFTALA